MSDEIKLLPCPFCGRNDEMVRVDHFDKFADVVCDKCGTEGPASEEESTAISDWNTRPIEAELRAQLAKQQKVIEAAKKYKAAYDRFEKADNTYMQYRKENGKHTDMPIELITESDNASQACFDTEAKLLAALAEMEAQQ